MSALDRDDAPDACVGLWITEDEARAMRVARGADGALRVSVWERRGRVAHLADRPARWHPPIAAAVSSANARERIGYLQVEVGDPGLGSTYDLMVATRNATPAASGGFEWAAVPPGTDRDAVRIFPQGGASYWEAVLGYYDDAVEEIRAADRWMAPLSTWRPATRDEEEREATPRAP